MNKLQRRVRSALAGAGLNQAILADHMNISAPALSRILNTNLTMNTAFLLADSLHSLTNETLTLSDFRKQS